MMTATILEGKSLATKIKDDIKSLIQKYLEEGLRAPELAVILVGNDEASNLYVHHKQKSSHEVGIVSHVHHLKETTSEVELLKIIHQLNENPDIDGILVQLPLPSHINTNLVVESIDPKKDVDGFHPYNLGRLMQQNPSIRPCTPFGIMLLLNWAVKKTGQSLHGQLATVVGLSNIVGKPMLFELLMEGCTVISCHRMTRNLAEHIRESDIVISATGQPHLIQGDWIKPKAIVIDVGMNRLENGELVGDVDFESAKEKAGFITPVPGGVGPMTVACLLKNCVKVYQMRMGMQVK